MSRTRVKICGVTNADDARVAVSAGVDALGMIVYPPSPRHVSELAAQEIRQVVPAFVSLVLVTVDMEQSLLKHWIQVANPDILQFHGNETAADALYFNLPYIKSLRMREDIDLANLESGYKSARALLLDTYVPNQVGGTGIAFDWSRAKQITRHSVILAGGLEPSTVGQAISNAHPFAVDVSSSLESAPGVKDHRAVYEFIQAVHAADCRTQKNL
ncbi:MAG: phosphoribosylanthranilate isomerase [Parasphingorhabdus sp.]|jgi:phosphoribosylanthranilate isomerase